MLQFALKSNGSTLWDPAPLLGSHRGVLTVDAGQMRCQESRVLGGFTQAPGWTKAPAAHMWRINSGATADFSTMRLGSIEHRDILIPTLSSLRRPIHNLRGSLPLSAEALPYTNILQPPRAFIGGRASLGLSFCGHWGTSPHRALLIRAVESFILSFLNHQYVTDRRRCTHPGTAAMLLNYLLTQHLLSTRPD